MKVASAIGALALLLACAVVSGLPAGASAEQASAPPSPAAGGLDAGNLHSCALVAAGGLRCWGFGASGQLGYGNQDTIGDDEVPGSAGPVNFGGGRSATAIAAGDFHSCALLDDRSVRCWGFGADGRLGYSNTADVSDPGSVGAVALGGPAKAISAGTAHTCALLEDGSVRCWGYGGGGLPMDGRLGYGDTKNVGDNETPAAVAPVKLGAGRTAVAISAGGEHTCALLDDKTVKCWGRNQSGQLGYGHTDTVGDRPTTTPDMVAPVSLPATATAISAGGAHSCALLGDGSVRCWGEGGAGQLGYGNTDDIGDNEPGGAGGAVSLGGTATAISVGQAHTCAVLGDGSVRCWGFAASGRLGYPDLNSFGNQNNVGDDETPASVGPVDVGGGRAAAISAGSEHSCARFDSGSVRCWGRGTFGRLGYCNQNTIGDDEPPGSVGPVALATPVGGGSGCSPGPAGSSAPPGPGPAPGGAATPVDALAAGLRAEAARRRGFRSCLSKAARHTLREVKRARRSSRAGRARARRHIKRHRSQLRARCVKRWGRTPARVTGLSAGAVSSSSIVLSFRAVGSDRDRSPAARSYIVKQSRRPIRSARAFRRAQTLCDGSCYFSAVTRVGVQLSLTITDLRPKTTYYYAVAARDNVSCRAGPRSRPARARTAAHGQPPPTGGHPHSGPDRTPTGGDDPRKDACRAVGK